MKFTPHLQKITDIHLFSDKDREVEPNGNITSIWLFIFIVLILLLISWVNYYNLSKARLLILQKQQQIQRIIRFGSEVFGTSVSGRIRAFMFIGFIPRNLGFLIL